MTDKECCHQTVTERCPECPYSLATISDAPAVLNLNDKAMWVLGFNAALAASPQPAQPGMTDERAEALIEATDGTWHEDVFHVEGPALMDLIRRASTPAQQGMTQDALDAARYRHVREHSYIEVQCDSPRDPEWQPAHLDSAIDAARASDTKGTP